MFEKYCFLHIIQIYAIFFIFLRNMNRNNNKRKIALFFLWLFLWYILYKEHSLSREQIIIFIVLRDVWGFLLLSNASFLKILGIVPVIWTAFLLLLWFLPLYKENPDTIDFSLTQQTTYWFIGNFQNSEIIDISEDEEQKIIPTQNNQQLFLAQKKKRTLTIQQILNNTQEEDKVVITFPDNTIYIAYAWSKITIEKTNTWYIITKITGKNEYYLPEKSQTTIKNANPQEQKNKSEFSMETIIDNYEKDKKEFIQQQAWWILIMEPTYQDISKKIIDIAAYIRPKQYQENQKNFEKYKEIFNWKNNETRYENPENRRNLILNQIKKWRKETRFLQ